MAYSDTPSGINNNPAGIAQVRHSEIEFSIEPHVLAGIRHKDSLGNDRRTDHDQLGCIKLLRPNLSHQ